MRPSQYFGSYPRKLRDVERRGRVLVVVGGDPGKFPILPEWAAQGVRAAPLLQS
jgi:hypothetical protein